MLRRLLAELSLEAVVIGLALAPGAPGHSALLEVAENAALRRVIEQHPGDERRHHKQGHRIGGDDKIGMRPKAHACTSCACISRMLRIRRLRISLRMIARCSVTKSSVNASDMISRGISNDGSMVGPPMRKTEAGWCSVFHQSTENLMIGRLTAPTSDRIAAVRAPRPGSSAVQ